MKIKRVLGGCITKSGRLSLKDNRLRVTLGKSDAAVDYGHVASALSIKLTISECYSCGKALDLTIAPIVGAGTLPFRGHVTPENAENLMNEFPDLRRISIQSSLLRHGYDRHKTVELVKKIKTPLQV